MDNGLNRPVRNVEPNNSNNKSKGCWSRFKSLFEDRGFDLEYEYTSHRIRPVPILGENTEEYRKVDVRTKYVQKTAHNHNSSETIVEESNGGFNFYEQFAILGDDVKDGVDLWRRSSNARNRISMRPSILLTNIAEETSLGEEIDEIETVSFRSWYFAFVATNTFKPFLLLAILYLYGHFYDVIIL